MVLVSELRHHRLTAISGVLALALPGAASQLRADLPLVVRVQVETRSERLLEGNDISFRRLPNGAGLSQTRVAQITQDDDGFLWFGTQSGLNRYDGYKCKVFKHDPARPGSLSGAFLYSLFKDKSGALWAGSDQYLDKFDPATETFSRLPSASMGLEKSVNFGFINQDSTGMLWLATTDGLYGVNPASGRTVHYRHDPNDAASLSDTEILSAGEDRSGLFWVAARAGLDQFDRQSGKVRVHIPLPDSGLGLWFHEDRSGTFWIIYGDGVLGVLDRKNNRLIRYSFQPVSGVAKTSNPVYPILEDRDGTMWFGTNGYGLLKYDRAHGRFISYNMRPGDPESLPDTRITALFQDREGNIWVGLHQTEPVYFNTKPPSFEKFTYQASNPNSLGSALVSVIHQDRDGVLWLGADRLLKRLDRKTGRYSTFEQITGHEVLAIVEQGPDVLWMGTAGLGLKRYDRRTGHIKTYLNVPGDLSSLCSDFTQKLLMDRKGNLWEANWGGLCSLDLATDRFTRYHVRGAGLTYHTIAEATDGSIWLGSNLGLQRLDPATGQFTEFKHTDDPDSLSDNRVNSIYAAPEGPLWLGTQNGLDRFDPRTNRFTHYNERDGLAGNVVSCVLEDHQHRLWMSTNAGISSFNPAAKRFNNYSVADGLPGPDLTGWGACFQSDSGEMFFGGFSGATAFHPDKIADDPYLPPVVLTDFRLFGLPAGLGNGSPLTRSITHSSAISLSRTQNIFSIEFSALSYAHPATNRYRYKLEALQQQWVEVGSEQRLASYTTLPAGDYTFRVQGATSRGAWAEPGTALRIQILPPWWGTWWFKAAAGLGAAGLLLALYLFRLRQLSARMQERLKERERSEEGLRARERDLSLIINTIPALAWSARPDGSADFLNQHYLDYAGLSADRARDWGWTASVHPDDLNRLSDYWRTIMASGQPGEIEARLRRFDGVYRWFLLRASPLRDKSGNIVKWYGTNADIEDRKRAEEEIKSSEEKYRVMFEAASDAVISMDDGGHVLLANSATARIFGYDPAELIGKPLTVLMPDYLRKLHEAGFRRYLTTGERHLNWQGTEVSALRKNGQEFPVEISFGEVTSNGHKIFTGYIRDLSETKRAQEALRASERELSLIIETIPGLVWCADPHGEIDYLNRRILDYIGATPGTEVRAGWTALLHADDVGPMERAWSRAIETGEKYEIQCRLRRADGVYRWFQVLGQPARGNEGGVTGWYGLLIDIDDRKNMEEALRDSQARLSRARQAATLAEISASVAHEINQPLAAAVTNGQVCLGWLSTKPPNVDKALAAGERAVRSVKDAGEVVRRIRALFKGAALEKVALDLNEVIGEVLGLLRSEAARRRIEVEADLAAELPPLAGDRVQLQQLILNLLLNGIEAMEPVTRHPKKLVIRSRRDNHAFVLVEVQDHGTGLKEPDKIFDAFYSTKENGMGMGLAICRSIVEAHHGRLWAASGVEPGAIFRFTLPTGSAPPDL